MASVTDLPLRESTSPRASDMPPFAGFQVTSAWQWVKAGFCLAFGAWVAVMLLAVPTAVIVGRLYLVAWLSMLNGLLPH